MFIIAATIKDIAREAEVAIGTVSKYLNGYKVKQINEQKIEKAIRDLDYQVNEFARGLKTNKSMTVGILIARYDDIFAAKIVSKIEHVLSKHGYGTIVCNYNENDDLYKKKITFLLNKKVGGIITTPEDHSSEIIKTAMETTPIVFLDCYIKEFATDTVMTDNFSAVYQATNEIIKRGHKKIGIIAHQKSASITNDERLSGYLKALESYYIDADESLIKCGYYTISGGYEAMNELLNASNPPTAVITTNYYMTIGAYMAIQNKKLVIPDDISFMGFDRMDIIDFFQPKLSIIEQPLDQIANQVARILMKRMGGKYEGFPEIVRLQNLITMTESVKDLRDL